MGHPPECVIRLDGGDYVLLDRETGVEYLRGPEPWVRHVARASYALTDAPRLGPVLLDGTTHSGFPEYVQFVAEDAVFRGQRFRAAVSEWTSGVLYPDHLGIGFTERLADVPAFTVGIETLTGRPVLSIRGSASVAGVGDPPLLGDWIRAGTFDPDRLARRFGRALGGTWVVGVLLKDPKHPASGHVVEINRLAGA